MVEGIELVATPYPLLAGNDYCSPRHTHTRMHACTHTHTYTHTHTHATDREHDKGPLEFTTVITNLLDANLDFRVSVLGAHTNDIPGR